MYGCELDLKKIREAPRGNVVRSRMFRASVMMRLFACLALLLAVATGLQVAPLALRRAATARSCVAAMARVPPKSKKGKSAPEPSNPFSSMVSGAAERKKPRTHALEEEGKF